MWRTFTALRLGLAISLAASAARAQSTAPASTPSPTPTPPPAATATPTPGTFDRLSPGGQKIALALCTAQSGGCPSASPSTSSPPQTASAPQPSPLTREQIAALKQHRGWGEIFKQMQRNGQIPRDVRNLGQLVSGRYQAPVGSSGITITTASGKSQVVGATGSHGSKGTTEGDPSISSAGDHANPGGGQSSASSHG